MKKEKLRMEKLSATLTEMMNKNFSNIDFNVESKFVYPIILDEILGTDIDTVINSKVNLLGSLPNVSLRLFDFKKDEIENLKSNIKKLILKDKIKVNEMLIIGDDRYKNHLEFINHSISLFETKSYEFYKFYRFGFYEKKLSELIKVLSFINDESEIKKHLGFDVLKMKDDLYLTGDKKILNYLKPDEMHLLKEFFKIFFSKTNNTINLIFQAFDKLDLSEFMLDKIAKKLIVGEKNENNKVDFIQYDELSMEKLYNKKVVFILGFDEAFFFKKGNELSREDAQMSFKLQEYQLLKKLHFLRNSLIFISSIDDFNYNEKYFSNSLNYQNDIDDFNDALVKADMEKLLQISKFNENLNARLKNIESSLKNDLSDFNFDKSKRFENSAFSVSKVESFNRCPFNSFLTYEMNLRKRESLTIEARVLGNFTHKALELIFNPENDSIIRGNEDEFISFVNKTLDLLIKEIPTNNKKEETFLISFISKFKKEIKIVREQYLTSNFKIYDIEKSISIKVGENTVTGKIDRVDNLKNNVLLIDYKSSSKDLTERSILEGTTLQLPLYAKYFKERGNNISGMFYKEIKGIKEKKEDDKNFLSGIALAESLNDIDTNLSNPTVLNVKFNKDGSISKSSKVYNDLNDFISLAEKVTLETIEKMKSNEISAKPIDARTCDYCNFKSICNKWC